MPANRLPLFGAGLRGRSAVVTAQHRQNIYCDVQAIEDRTRIAFYGTAGLVQRMVLGDSSRGWVVVGDYLYSVNGATFYQITDDFVATPLGVLQSLYGKVGIVCGGQQIFIVDGDHGYVYNIGTGAFAMVSDSDFPNNSRTCAWQDGYFIFEDGDDFQLSDLDDATSHDATRRASAETIPDSIIRVFADDNVMLFGPVNTEFWANTGALDFPYARLGGGSTLKVGLAARWSLCAYQDGVAFLGRTRGGGPRLYALSKGGLQAISTTAWEETVEGYGDISEATGLAYSYGGHDFYQINFGHTSWQWDGILLNELRSSGARHRADAAIMFNDEILVSDYQDGRIYKLDPTVYDDAGYPIIREMTSRHLFGQQPVPVTDLWVDVESGVGIASGQGVNPQLMLTVSRDGGRTFGEHQWCSAGAIGEYQTRCRFGAQGASYDFTFRLSMSDPVRFVVVGEGWVDQ